MTCQKLSGAPGEIRTPDPLLRSLRSSKVRVRVGYTELIEIKGIMPESSVLPDPV